MSVRGLHKIIYPFAPDQSGAASVLYELGGMIIICDAGGCAGNVCGFDEPRWLRTKSAVFSAGLRDMDAILGRDDLLIEKITSASEKLQSKFIAILGTPVPATIATDYKALRRMAEKRTGLPVITIDTNGIRWYDDGISKAYREMFRRFAVDGADGDGDRTDVISDSAGVIGASPLDTGYLDAGSRIREILRSRGITESVCYGSGDTLEKTADARRMEKNIVISAAGLKAARYLRDRFGTPYVCEDPFIETVMSELEASCLEETGHELYSELEGKRVLVMHQPRIKTNSTPEEIAYKRQQFDSLRRSMDELVPVLEKMDAKIALENMPGDTWEFLRYLLDNYPPELFGLCFDCGHANINLKNQFAECEEYKSRICSVHLHDNNGTGDQHLAPFYGTVDWERTAKLLDSSAYTGVINFELHVQKSPFFNPAFPGNAQPPEAEAAYMADIRERCERFARMCQRNG